MQQLKDILNEKYPSLPSAETPPIPPDAQQNHPMAPEETAEPEAAEPSTVPGDTAEAEADRVAGPLDGHGSGSGVDQLETVPYPPPEEFQEEEWPPCPSIPKTSLLRWRKPATFANEDSTAHFAMTFTMFQLQMCATHLFYVYIAIVHLTPNRPGQDTGPTETVISSEVVEALVLMA